MTMDRVQLARLVLSLLNLAITCTGISLIAIGVWIIRSAHPRIQLDTLLGFCNQLNTTAYILIGTSVCVTLHGLLGICAIITKRTFVFRGPYIILLFCIMGGYITACLMGINVVNDINDMDSKKFVSLLQQRYDAYGNFTNNTRLDFTRSMDALQQSEKCCGFSGPVDYMETLGILPYSCCRLSHHEENITNILNTNEGNYSMCIFEAQLQVTNPQFVYMEGCNRTLFDRVLKQSCIIVVVCFGLACFQILCFVLLAYLRGKRSSADKKEDFPFLVRTVPSASLPLTNLNTKMLGSKPSVRFTTKGS